MKQIPPKMKEELEKQQYRIVGNHSAVKICGWTKSQLQGNGVCYKYSFYGIRSHQCLQCTSSMFCASRCLFCWRGDKAPVSKEWYDEIDEPKDIVDGMLEQQRMLLNGFLGNEKVDDNLKEEMQEVKHVALSLTGEPITYPKINELLDEFHKRKMSTFLVSNAQYPKEIESIKNVTQLYLSIDAPNKELFKKIDRPLFTDYYERMLASLDVLAKKKYRTCIRLTLIKEINDCCYEDYADLINKGDPDFVEVKAYMFVGDSRNNLEMKNMPLTEDVHEFSSKLDELLEDYDIVAEHKSSRVVLLKKKCVKQFIDFKKFYEIISSGEDLVSEDYSADKMCDN